MEKFIKESLFTQQEDRQVSDLSAAFSRFIRDVLYRLRFASAFKVLLLTSYLSLLTVSAFSQNILFNKITLPDVSPSAPCITQDLYGNIWLTGDGISRYDGVNLKTYTNDRLNPNSISNNRVECIYADKSGNIWAGTWSGLEKLDPKTGIFTHYKHKERDPSSISGDTITSILQDRDGMLWIGTNNTGLNRLDPKTGKFTHYRHKENDPNSLSFDQVRVIYEDKKGVLWIGCGSPFFAENQSKNGGLNRLDKKTGKFISYLHNEKDPRSLIDNRVRAILEDSHGNFWVGTAGDGLHTMNRETGLFERHTYDPAQPEKLSRPPLQKFITIADDHITFITEDSRGAIWIGAFEAGLSRYDPQSKKITRYNGQNSNTGNFTDSTSWSTFTSRDGVIWIATWLGETYRVDPSHQNIHHTPLNINARVYSFLEEPGQALYLGTDSGLMVIDKKNNSSRLFRNNSEDPLSISDNIVFSLYKDRKNRIWIGTIGYGGGLNLYNPEKQNFTVYKHDPKNSTSLVFDAVNCIYEDQQSNLWVGTENGLHRMNVEKGEFTLYKPFPEDTVPWQKNHVLCMLEDSKHNLWVGTMNQGGLHILDRKSGKFKHYLNRHSVLNLLEDKSGKLWAGTEEGLYSYNPAVDSFSLFTDPTSGTGFYTIGIVEDNDRNLWTTTPTGLIRINRERNVVSKFAKNFGINPFGFTGTKPYKMEDGQLLFGINDGYYSLYPDKISSNPNPPEIVLTDFRIADRLVKPGSGSALNEDLFVAKQIDLKHDQNVFSFYFNVVHYSNSEANRAIYKLENYDQQWRPSGADRTAYYYNIPPGRYTFRIKAASSYGVWTERSIDVIITPPWWRSWWAYVMYGLLLLAIAYALHRIQKQRVINAELERTRVRELAQAKEIEKAYHELKMTQAQLIQSEKMASLGELTAGIAHEIQNPLNFVNNFAEVNKELLVEMKGEIKKGNLEDIDLIADDLISNEEKISHHGKRADSIVKGMLLHSRSNTGEKELTDLNALADEYLRLAYHGLRAKDKTFNSKLETNLDGSIGKINLVPQDMGRVLLNLINNAFFAVDVKQKQNQDGYEPQVSITTRKQNGKLELTIKDNGNGIPEKIADKIFQPFFTTKSTGQGTGLGLSISYDIIKAHGGEINVRNKPGEGAEFIITLPLANDRP